MVAAICTNVVTLQTKGCIILAWQCYLR